MAVRLLPASDDIDAAAITSDLRQWLNDGRHPRFRVEERRCYVDVGASGSVLDFVLDLLASGAVGVTLQEVVSFLKKQIGVDAAEVHAERFESLAVDQLRDECLAEAERALGLGRGDLVPETVERNRHEIRMLVKRLSSGDFYQVTRTADRTLHVLRLGGNDGPGSSS